MSKKKENKNGEWLIFAGRCRCGCEDNDDEAFPFICQRCNGFHDCEVHINDFCLCPDCDKEIYDKLMAEKIKKKEASDNL